VADLTARLTLFLAAEARPLSAAVLARLRFAARPGIGADASMPLPRRRAMLVVRALAGFRAVALMRELAVFGAVLLMRELDVLGTVVRMRSGAPTIVIGISCAGVSFFFVPFNAIIAPRLVYRVMQHSESQLVLLQRSSRDTPALCRSHRPARSRQRGSR
jgi:hypothetical protein